MQTLALTLNMSGALRQQGKIAESGPYYRRAYDGFRVKYGQDLLRTLIAQNNFANYLIDDAKAAEAVAMATEAVNLALARTVREQSHHSRRIPLHARQGIVRGTSVCGGRKRTARSLDAALRRNGQRTPRTPAASPKKLAELKRALKQEAAAAQVMHGARCTCWLSAKRNWHHDLTAQRTGWKQRS